MTEEPLEMQLLRENPEAMAIHERTKPQHEFVLAVLEARTKLGWTQRDLATAMGVSQPVISRLESGDHDVKLNTGGAVCKVLGIEFTMGGRNLVSPRPWEDGMPAKRLDQQLMEQDLAAMAERERTCAQHEFVFAVLEGRAKRGWTQRDLAAAMGVSQPVIARLESGDHDVKLNTVGAVCKALGIEFTIGGRNLVPQDVPAKRRSA